MDDTFARQGLTIGRHALAESRREGVAVIASGGDHGDQTMKDERKGLQGSW